MRDLVRIAGAAGLVLFAAGCADSSRMRTAAPAPVAAASAKYIANDGAGGLVLPDGTRVATDSSGGFTLPNGAYVRRDASGALNLPNGSRCVPDGRGGYNCP